MKKRVLLMVLLIKFICHDGVIRAHNTLVRRKVDPMSDFSYPLSLVEMLHQKINNLHHLLDGVVKRSQSVTFDELESQFVDLSTLYDDTIDTSFQHTMRSGDKEFLEKMIERIDQLIAQLESTGQKKNGQKLKRLSDEFKHKILVS